MQYHFIGASAGAVLTDAERTDPDALDRLVGDAVRTFRARFVDAVNAFEDGAAEYHSVSEEPRT